MSVKFTAEAIINATGGRLVSGEISELSGSICADLNQLQAGQWFVALPSAQTDGHDQLEDALARGALGCVVVDRRRYPFAPPGATLIAVPSSLQAYYELAKIARRQINPKVIAITGSSGKSSTRDMCTSILSLGMRVHASSRNRPDARSLAENVLAMPETTEVLVVELSQRGRGQISWLAAWLVPDICVITNIGLAHLETLGSIQNIAAAKCELLESLCLESGLAILGDTNSHLLERASVVFGGGRALIFNDGLEEVCVKPENTLFALSGSDTLFEISAHGSAYLRDAWCAIMCAKDFGMPDHKIAEGLRRYEPPRGRGNKIVAKSGALIYDESYSATPDSVRAAITAFLDKRAVPHPRKYIVLGEMQELGEASDGIHAKLGQWLSSLSFDGLITIGEAAAHIVRGVRNAPFETLACVNANDAYKAISAKLDEKTSVLVDGSDAPDLRSVISLLVTGEVDAPRENVVRHDLKRTRSGSRKE